MVKRHWRNKVKRQGAALVEAALVLPLVLMFMLGVMEYGRWFMMVHTFNNAASAAAAYASKHGSTVLIDGTSYGSATSDVSNVVTASLAGQQLTGQSVTVYQADSSGNNLGAWTNAQPGQYVCVKIAGTYKFMLPTLLKLPATKSVSFQAIKRSEGN